MSRVVHFEIHSDNPKAAMRFYGDLFQWKFNKWNGPWDYWMISTGDDSTEGINGGLFGRRGPAPTEGQAVNAYVCTVDVADLDATLQAVTTAGGTTAHPKMPIPGVGWLAYAKDPSGNLFGMMQEDPGAK